MCKRLWTSACWVQKLMPGINCERYLLPGVSSLVVTRPIVSDKNFGVTARGSRILSMSIFFNLLYCRAPMKLYQTAVLGTFSLLKHKCNMSKEVKQTTAKLNRCVPFALAPG